MSFWRDRARRLIAELTRDLPETATVAERRKALWGKGYPAHGGTSWGRKMWGSEVRRHLAAHGVSTARVSGKPVQWPADVCFPFAKQGEGE